MFKEKLRYIGYYFQYKDKIYSYFWYRTGKNREIAEDLTQDVFLRAWKEFDKFSESRPFQSWIFKIAHNKLVDYYRAYKIEIDLDRLLSFSGKETPSPELEIILDKLPEKEKKVLVLKYIHGFEYKEIGKLTAQSEGAARVMAHRALKKIKKLKFK